MGSHMAVLVAGGSMILGVASCRDSTTQAAPALILSITAVSALNQQGTVNQFLPSNPTVRVTDAPGHPVPGVTVVFTASYNSPASATTGPDGTASFRWKLGTVAGTQEVATAISSGHSTLNGPSFAAVALPDSLAIIRAVSPTSQVGVELENPPALPVILALDQFNNAKSGVAVTFEVVGGDGVAWATTTTDATGLATAGGWKLGATVGTDTLVARAQTVGPVYFTARVVPPFTATSVVSGATHSCALTPGGDVYCWGDNRTGQARPTSSSGYVQVPEQVVLPTKLVSLSALNGHTCGISNESPPQAYCWGLNNSGQLGLPGTSVASAAVRVPVAEGLAAVTAGAEHTCGLTAAGVAYCWGDDSFGQLGTADTLSCSHSDFSTTCSGPRRVASDSRFIALAAGPWHTCGLTTADQLYCWGLDDNGQLGLAVAEACTEYVAQFDENDPVACALTPQLVPGSSNFTSVAGGVFDTCGLTASGSVSCYGRHIGMVSAGPFVRLSLDGDCGIAADGTAYCWDSFDSPGAALSTPVRIGGGRTFATLSAALGTALGPSVVPNYTPPSPPHRCGVLSSNSAVVCWGANDFGQLGNGTTTSSAVPQAVIVP
jgi:hypothetical protein